MKPLVLVLFGSFILTACTTPRPINGTADLYQVNTDPPITRSLFEDKNSTISEENIQKILDGSYSLPEKLRVAFVKLESSESRRSYYRSDEQYLKSQQQYLELFSGKFGNSSRVTRIAALPEILISTNPTFTQLRETAVRTQSDIVVVYSINSDIYSQYKLFSKATIKAFATTQLIIMDVRTGLIPFTTIVTRDFEDKRNEEDLNDTEAVQRIKNQAILATIEEIGEQVEVFLSNDN